LIEYAMHNTYVPVGPWRGVNTNQNAVYMGCLIEEAARAAGTDSLEFRRALMGRHPKHLAVLNAAAEKGNWGQALPAGVHRGMAQFMGYGSYSAAIAEVSVNAEGQIKVHRMVLAINCGHAVNPDQIAAQVEGSVAYGLAAGSEQIVGTITAGQTSGEMAFLTLEPRVSSVPARERCEVRILKSGDLRLLGAHHPVISAELGRALARRLAKATVAAVGESPIREKGRSPMADLQSLAKRVATDADFMRRLVSDPERTLNADGIAVTPEMLKAIKALDAEEMERAVRAFAESKPGAAM